MFMLSKVLYICGYTLDAEERDSTTTVSLQQFQAYSGLLSIGQPCVNILYIYFGTCFGCLPRVQDFKLNFAAWQSN